MGEQPFKDSRPTGTVQRPLCVLKRPAGPMRSNLHPNKFALPIRVMLKAGIFVRFVPRDIAGLSTAISLKSETRNCNGCEGHVFAKCHGAQTDPGLEGMDA